MTVRPVRLTAATVAALVLSAAAATAQTPTLPYDHVHLNVPDPAVAATWYEKQFGGRRIDEAPDRLMFGSTRLAFLRSEKAAPSAGSAIDHIGFSVRDLDATMKALEAAGARVTTPAREVEGLFKLAFVEDPWGTRIEVVQDAELLGFHHLHLRAPDPEKTMAWLLAQFGGERARMKGRIDGLKYGAAGFSDVWVLVQKGEATPSQGKAIDHLGWRVASMGQLAEHLKARGVPFASEPRPLTMLNKTTITFAFVESPDGARIELVERPGLAPGR